MKMIGTKDKRLGRVGQLLATATLVLGVVAAPQVNAAIKDTKHNLGSTNNVSSNSTNGTAEICVFCHTPHASNTSVKAPLWNKPVNTGGYTVYNTAVSATIDGGVDMSGISLACLSCHDGTQSMDVMINAPGSGGYNATGSRMSPSTWSGSGVNASGVMQSSTIAMLGTDLTNDHPVGIQYCGGGIYAASTSAASQGTCRDGDFNAATSGTIGGATAWWVNTGGTNLTTREKTDMILYARTPVTSIGTGAANTSYQPFVECASCHDPHSSNATFLRVANTGSAVCLACHNK